MKRNMWVVLCFIVVFIMGLSYWSYRQKEGIRFVKSMGSGINIGNSLDSTNVKHRKENATVEFYETYWSNPVITKELFQMIQREGFATVRIPVSWDEHVNDNGIIDPKWLDRVEEVVTYGLDAGLFVILNTHHESWLIPMPEHELEVLDKLSSLWEQIGTRFQNYPEQLLFEGMNEPRTVGSKQEWKGGTKKEWEIINRLNETFVTTIRSLGGNNKNRWLILTSYGGNVGELPLTSLKLPKDHRIILAAHAYTPYKFTQDMYGTDEWSKSKAEDVEAIGEFMERLYQLFIKKNIPVILTEFGSKDKDNLVQRVEWAKYYMDMASRYNIATVWWDNGKEYGIMDRRNLQWKHRELVEVLTEKR